MDTTDTAETSPPPQNDNSIWCWVLDLFGQAPESCPRPRTDVQYLLNCRHVEHFGSDSKYVAGMSTANKELINPTGYKFVTDTVDFSRSHMRVYRVINASYCTEHTDKAEVVQGYEITNGNMVMITQHDSWLSFGNLVYRNKIGFFVPDVVEPIIPTQPLNSNEVSMGVRPRAATRWGEPIKNASSVVVTYPNQEDVSYEPDSVSGQGPSIWATNDYLNYYLVDYDTTYQVTDLRIIPDKKISFKAVRTDTSPAVDDLLIRLKPISSGGRSRYPKRRRQYMHRQTKRRRPMKRRRGARW